MRENLAMPMIPLPTHNYSTRLRISCKRWEIQCCIVATVYSIIVVRSTNTVFIDNCITDKIVVPDSSGHRRVTFFTPQNQTVNAPNSLRMFMRPIRLDRTCTLPELHFGYRICNKYNIFIMF